MDGEAAQDTRSLGLLLRWAQGALASARVEVRRLRRQPDNPVALNELGVALHVAKRYTGMACRASAHACAVDLEDRVYKARTSCQPLDGAWLDAVERGIAEAEAALVRSGDADTPSGTVSSSASRPRWNAFADVGNGEGFA